MDLEKFLAGIRSRKDSSSRWGIGTASHYLRALQRGLGDISPAKLLEGDASNWEALLKRADNQPTYCDPRMLVYRRTGSPNRDRQLPVIPGSCGVFDCVVTSDTTDRDGDILESAGGELDPRAPLLMHHLPVLVTGRVLEQIFQDTHSLEASCAVMDGPAGRDAMQLVEFDALRISHGFRPLDYEPLENDKSAGDCWRIKRFEIMEISLVPIPSNTDAVVLVYDKGLLEDPLVKAWGKSLYDSRPKVFRGMPEFGKDVQKPITVKASVTEKVGDVERTKTLESEDAGQVTDWLNKETQEKSILPHIDSLQGSFEWVSERLATNAEGFLKSAGIQVREDKDWIGSVATFPDRVILCVIGCDRPWADDKCFEIDWANQDGQPTLSGDPKEVRLVGAVERVAAVAANRVKAEHRFTGQTSEANGHSHTVGLDGDGNGSTGPADGHSHGVENFVVIAADGHTHAIDRSSLQEASVTPSNKTTVPFRSYPAADTGRPWNSTAAVGRIRNWARVTDSELDLSKASHRNRYKEGFAFVRGDPEDLGSYILPHHDVVDGQLRTVLGGISAAAGAINGARAQIGLSDDDRRSAFNHVAKHYDVFEDNEAPDFRVSSDPDMTKDGRRLAGKTVVLLSTALDLVKDIAGDSGASERINALAERAISKIEEVLQLPEPIEASEASIAVALQKLTAELFKGNHEAKEQLSDLKRDVDALYGALKAQENGNRTRRMLDALLPSRN